MPVLLPENGQCARCLERLRDAVLQIAGVQNVRVDPSAGQVTLVYDPNLLSLDDVRRRAEHIGVQMSESIAHQRLDLTGMDCPDCATKLEKAVGRLPGVLSAEVSYAASRMLVEYQAGRVDLPAIVRRIQDLGYDAEVGGKVVGSQTEQAWWQQHRLTIATAASGLFLLAGFLLGRLLGNAEAPAARALYGLAVVSGAFYMARSAFRALLAGTFDTNFLMLLAAVGALGIGQWAEGGMVVFLFSLGNTLEAFTAERTRASIRSLMSLAPPTALVVAGDQEAERPVASVRPGEVVRVKPGGAIPLDGLVVRGQSSVNQAPITGESMPVSVGEGSEVFGGTLNQEGSLEIRVEKAYQDTALARIIHLVEEAQAQKAPLQRFTEAFGRVYTPAVIVLALGCALVVPLALQASGLVWLHKALTLLVVACPCALVISTPVAVAAALGRAARQGILIKGGAYLEALGSVKVVAFDKTGTLTSGRPMVVEVVAHGMAADRLVSLAASVERHSEHPIASAVMEEASRRGLRPLPATEFRAVPGRGSEAKVDGRAVKVGNGAYLAESGIGLPLGGGEWSADGRTPIYVAVDGKAVGALAVEDSPREQAAVALEALREAGVSRIVMLTGDEEGPARSVAKRLGIDDVRYGLLPEQKVEALRELMGQYGRVAMVGDGVNDAPALALATVGIAMGTAGTDAALETADVALMGDDLAQLPYAVRLSRRSLRVMRQNIGFALLVVLLLVGTTLTEGLRLSLGVAGHEGSALLVIANGMRLLGDRDHRGGA